MDLSTAASALRVLKGGVVTGTALPDDIKDAAMALYDAMHATDVSTVDVAKTQRMMLFLTNSDVWQAQAAGLLLAAQLLRDVAPAREASATAKAVAEGGIASSLPTAGSGAAAGAVKALAESMITPETIAAIVDAAKAHLENREPRVRNTVVDVMQWAAATGGLAVFDAVYPAVIASIRRNFERDDGTDASGAPVIAATAPGSPTPEDAAASAAESTRVETTSEASSATATDADGASSVASISSTTSSPAPKPAIAHDTVGWKALESSFRALMGLVRGCGPLLIARDDAGEGAAAEERPLTVELLSEVIPRATDHVNRFVRQAVYSLAESIVVAVGGDGLVTLDFADSLAELLAKGLADNWSQVRYAASCCTRAFMLEAASYRSKYHELLVPRMALNRYYVAEGVKLYSQQTWRVVMGAAGPGIVASVIDAVVAFYLAQSDADNHAVREAACHCIAELAHKVDKDAVRPHVAAMLAALIVCFKDESWPVRDAACLASGRFVAGFPEESRPSMDELYHLWFDHVADNIWSVREDSAVALHDVMTAYGDEAVARVVAKLSELLPQAKDQPHDSEKFSDLSSGSTLFGVAAKKARDNDVDAHTGNQVYSCGSLAPKLRKGGCMDHGFARPKQPWEATDGAVYLLRELASVAPAKAEPFMETLAEVARLQHFVHFTSLQETIWKQLPAIARHLGKRPFKRYLERLMGPMFVCLAGDHRLSSHAAGECIGAIRDYIGPSIFAGRLDADQEDAMRRYASLIPPPSGSGGPRGPGMGMSMSMGMGEPMMGAMHGPGAFPFARGAPAGAAFGAGAGAGAGAGVGVGAGVGAGGAAAVGGAAGRAGGAAAAEPPGPVSKLDEFLIREGRLKPPAPKPAAE